MRRVILIALVFAALVCAQTTKKINTSTRNSTVQVAEKINDNDNQSKFDFYPTMGYQGLLKDNEGKFVTDGTYKVSFKIYDSETGETAIWKEVQDVEISKGIISCHIGAAEKLNLPFDKQYWLSVSIDGDELPRMIMGGTPYSLHARRIAEDAIVGGKNISVSKDEDGKIVLRGEGSGKSATNNLFDASSGGGIRMATCNTTVGSFGVALGCWSSAKGTSSFACGPGAEATNYSTAMGVLCKSLADYSLCLGRNDTVSVDGVASTAIGQFNKVTDSYSMALGLYNLVEGEKSLAVGYRTKARGLHSRTFGSYNEADGDNSTAIGNYCFSEGDYGLSIGLAAHAMADYSISIGKSMRNQIDRSFMVGFNSDTTPETHTVDPTLYADSSRVCIGLSKDQILSAINNREEAVLHVNGDMYATKIIVQTDDDNWPSWPDYVFEKEYDLKNLSEVEAFISSNKHLPDVPSSDEIGRTGNDLGTMDKILLRKIEEMTLYIIDQEKRIKELETKAGE